MAGGSIRLHRQTDTMIDLAGAHQRMTARRWTLLTYLSACRTGWELYMAELLESVGLTRTDKQERLRKRSNANHASHIVNNQQELTGINYMFWVYSRVSSLSSLWVPSFIFDIRAGTEAPAGWALHSYFVGLAGIVLGTLVALTTFSNTIKRVLPRLVARANTLMSTIALMSEVGYVAFGLVCMMWITWNRRFIHDFVLYTCSSIRLPAEYQRKTFIRLYLPIVLFALIAEPSYVIITVLNEFKQPEVAPQLDPRIFQLLRLGALVALLVALLPLSVLHTLVPAMTCSLSCLAAKHIEMSLEKQLDRLYGKKQHSFVSLRVLDTEQEAKMTPDDHTLVRQFAIDTLYSDWPSIGERPANPSKDTDDNLAVRSRLFLYKSIVKTLGELKTITRRYDRVFGNIHAMLITLNGVLVAEWVVVGVIQSRLATLDGQSAANKNTLINPFLFHTYFSVFLFVTSNAIMFAKCNQLPSQLQKLRVRLFKSNIRLVYQISQASSCARDGIRTELSNHRGARTTLTQSPLGDRYELDLCWSLYDQVDRLSREANFKLTSNTYYGKRCLLLIFSREVSLVLLYMQVIDIYSNAS